ncbi:hypothetical protein CSKR_106281 [Clonorchis sinensis]|uniref:Uncharacterized protein n=1 Tax=Clonorchis sinensis TaxID=79923 RepID=A0A419PZE8_CLOSI|nr:hypothetical protein CSKR_106281 [Clonorchis sinensis]
MRNSVSIAGHPQYSSMGRLTTQKELVVKQEGKMDAIVFTETDKMARWLKREFTDRKVPGSNPISASRLPLSRLWQPGSILTLVSPSVGMADGHQKSASAERFYKSIYIVF